MALLASGASEDDKLKGLFQHILLSSNDESLKTALSAYMLQQSTSSNRSNGSNGNNDSKKGKKKKIAAELKDLPPPKDGESHSKYIASKDKTAVYCDYCKRWSYFLHHTTERCYRRINEQEKSATGTSGVSLRANLASLAVDEDDMFTPVISLACATVNTDTNIPHSTYAFPPQYRDFSLDVSVDGYNDDSIETASNNDSFQAAPLGMLFDEMDGPYLTSYQADPNVPSILEDEYDSISVTNSVMDDLHVHNKSFEEVFLERR